MNNDDLQLVEDPSARRRRRAQVEAAEREVREVQDRLHAAESRAQEEALKRVRAAKTCRRFSHANSGFNPASFTDSVRARTIVWVYAAICLLLLLYSSTAGASIMSFMLPQHQALAVIGGVAWSIGMIALETFFGIKLSEEIFDIEGRIRFVDLSWYAKLIVVGAATALLLNPLIALSAFLAKFSAFGNPVAWVPMMLAAVLAGVLLELAQMLVAPRMIKAKAFLEYASKSNELRDAAGEEPEDAPLRAQPSLVAHVDDASDDDA